MADLTQASVEQAFEALDGMLDAPVSLILGGGTAMMLAYQLPVRTTDADAYPEKGSPEALEPLIKRVARKLGLKGDWLNFHFATFAHVLPADYGTRLKDVFVGRRLRVRALGLEDLLIMKAFAGRAKDVGHARALLKRGADQGRVEARLQELADKRVPGAREALDFFDDVQN